MRIASLLCLLLACSSSEEDVDVPAEPATWSYPQLTVGERAVVEHERDAVGWARVHAGFAAAVRGAAKGSDR